MTVKYSKERTLRPLDIHFRSLPRFGDIEDDTHSVFIVITNYSLIGICCVWFYVVTFLGWCLGWIVVFKNNFIRIYRSRILTKKYLLNIHNIIVFMLFSFFEFCIEFFGLGMMVGNSTFLFDCRWLWFLSWFLIRLLLNVLKPSNTHNWSNLIWPKYRWSWLVILFSCLRVIIMRWLWHSWQYHIDWLF